MTPDEIHQNAVLIEKSIQKINMYVDEACKQATDLNGRIDPDEHIDMSNEMDSALAYLFSAKDALAEVSQHNEVYAVSANRIEETHDSGSGPDNLIADCHEKLKAGLVGLGPGESYSITVRKDVENVVTTDMSAEEFAKRFRQNYQA